MKPRTFTIWALIFLVLCVLPGPASATYYPNEGTMSYNGADIVEHTLLWYSPGPWCCGDFTGYEHDTALNFDDPLFETSCTSATNLPFGYDDCPTAGFDEPSTYISYTFGSFTAEDILGGIAYWGAVYFATTLCPANFTIIGQEMYNNCMTNNGFPCYSIWNMFSNRSQPLLSYRIEPGDPFTYSWFAG